MSDDSTALWAAVDAITAPTKRKLERSAEDDWRAAAVDETGWVGRYAGGDICHVPTHQAHLDRLEAATLAYGEIPSLWQQATWAVATGSEQNDEGGSSPLRERSPADLDLMETMLTIRETVEWELTRRKVKPRDGVPVQLRQMASEVIRTTPTDTALYAAKLRQWARLIIRHLDNADHAPKPVYLRSTPCPKCGTRQVRVDRDGEKLMVPALKVDFTGDLIRAAHCQHCGSSWFRGPDLHVLGDLIGHAG